MNISWIKQQVYRWSRLWIGIVLIVTLTLTSCSQPAPSDQNVKISPELEKQILQVIRAHPEAILESVQAYQQQQDSQLQQARETFLGQMKANPQSIIGGSPATGASAQNIVLVEFSDFQCPFCARAHQTIEQFMKTHQDQVTLVYKHFPLTQIHPQALNAAKASWAAQQQGKFWEYQNALFTQQNQLGEELYIAIAQQLNLDLDKFNRDRQGKEAQAAIQKDIQLAESLGISGTPFFIMNGETFSGAVELSKVEEVLAQVKASKG
ncbi:DSBA oxidoreductase [Planktothrix serta PCC 8927]|uniref:DSBA oxidoreductase n=1 Tax=Planktothrix serta PCC 8927 TaxID=671068 RepID=A0A7Z9DWI1_9CYAN|nr:thioredoxin domain-containing protein [Planktothrix serta]VXD12462.1 DSBA oxidoreductase [Planktothrix serta PCC 8927]